MSELRRKQSKFVLMVARLINFATENGYELSFGDAYRDPRTNGGQGEKKGYSAARSAHKNRLAVDFNLFKDGRFLQSTKDHEPLGLFWESIGGTWGGRWHDGNHYSVKFGGIS